MWKNILLFLYQLRKTVIMIKTIASKLRFIDSFRFMLTSLSELVDNVSGIVSSIECKSCIEKIKINSECCFVGLKNNRLIYKCKECKEEWKRPINELIENFPGVYQFCNNDLNKFVLLLRYYVILLLRYYFVITLFCY